MFYKNNWFTYSYDSILFGKKTSTHSIFDIELTPTVTTVKSYYEELKDNATRIRDTYTGKLDLLFSGGIDSEVVLRIYNDLKIPINICIFKYENDYNYYEFNRAVKICDSMQLPYTVIDFNLQKFFETDAYDIWTKVHCMGSGWLPLLKMIEYLDNIPIMGDGEPLWVFNNTSWEFELEELPHAQGIYCTNINRPMITDWYEYSPEVILTHALLPRIQTMRNSLIEVDGNQIKYLLYKDLWPEIVLRPKRNGFEKFNTQPRVTSLELQSLIQFQKQHIDTLTISNTVYSFSNEQLFNFLVYDYEPNYQSVHSDPHIDSLH